jgi:IS5 family transposase
LEALIEQHYPKAGKGRQQIGASIMMRVYFLLQWFKLSDQGLKLLCMSRRDCSALQALI